MRGTPASSQIIWLEDKVKEQADEIERLRVVVEDAIAWCERNDNEPYWLADARAALKEGE